jgi:hypothetical protein
MIPIIQHNCDLIGPKVFQLMIIYAINPPKVPKMMVDAPTLMVKYLMKTADVTFPKYYKNYQLKQKQEQMG